MARYSSGKPWLHEKSGYWCTTIDRHRVYLDKDYKAACQKLRRLHAERKRASQGVTSEWLDAPIANLADEFLDDVQARRKPATHVGYRYRLLRALEIVGPNTRVADLGKLHLAKIEQRMTAKYSPSTVKDTIAALQAVFSWSVKHDLLIENPLVGYEKPAARVRTRTITDSEFQALLRHSDLSFRRVLLALRFTGCRPVEIRTLVWDWVDLETGLWILKDHKTITRQRQPRPRIIPLAPPIWKLCQRLSATAHGPADCVFLNSRGNPYSKDALCRKMARVRKRAGIDTKAGERLVLYCTGTPSAPKRPVA